MHHLPYQIDEAKNRKHSYETLWKKTALDLLEKETGNLKGMTLLDYGCGRGETMDLASKREMIVTGTDLDPECVRLSSTFGKASLLDVEAPVQQFGENSFDVVACFHVLEHVPRPLETMRDLRKIARKYVLVAVPNLSRPKDYLRKRNWDGKVNEGHLQSWDHSHFRNLAEKHCGMKILAWGHDAVVFPPFSNVVERAFGDNAAKRLETGLFKKLWPYASISVIALLAVES